MWYISNKKRAEEKAKESQKAKEKNYEDYAWKAPRLSKCQS